MVTEFSVRMQDWCPTLRAPIDKFGSTQYAVIVLLENVREIAASRTQVVLVFLLTFGCHRRLNEILRNHGYLKIYNSMSEIPKVKRKQGEKEGCQKKGSI